MHSVHELRGGQHLDWQWRIAAHVHINVLHCFLQASTMSPLDMSPLCMIQQQHAWLCCCARVLCTSILHMTSASLRYAGLGSVILRLHAYQVDANLAALHPLIDLA